jgi:heptaprenyl diphosphate synthase
MKGMNTHKLALLAMLLALAIALGVADYYIPFPFIPGAKLGLANIIILVTLYELGIWEACFIDLGRVFIVSLITGRIFQLGFYMSLGGAFLSILVMILLKFLAHKMTIIGISACASISHGFAQVLVYCAFLGNWTAFYYYPLMSLIAIVTGVLIGILADRLIKTRVIERQKQRYGFDLPKKKAEEAPKSIPLPPEEAKKEDEASHPT